MTVRFRAQTAEMEIVTTGAPILSENFLKHKQIASGNREVKKANTTYSLRGDLNYEYAQTYCKRLARATCVNRFATE
jgi:hypothetical protein